MLAGEIAIMIGDCRRLAAECHRPNGELCIQCRERELVADRLESILLANGYGKDLIEANA